MSSGILAIHGHPPTPIPLRQASPTSDVLVDHDALHVDQDISPPQSFPNSDNVHTDAPIVLLLNNTKSLLRNILRTHLIPHDVKIILFVNEDQLYLWLNNHVSHSIASVIVQANIRSRPIISRIHMHMNIQSILLYCPTADIKALQRYSRSYPKIDAIFDDTTRILIKLVVDLTLVCEETGDRQLAEHKETEAQRNYQRALGLCALVQKL